MLEQITISVDAETARLYREADEAKRRRLGLHVAVALAAPELAAGNALAAWREASDKMGARLSDEQVREIEAELG